MSIDNFTNWIAFGDFSETGTAEKAFDPSKHPRGGKGTPQGGKFVAKVGDRITVNPAYVRAGESPHKYVAGEHGDYYLVTNKPPTQQQISNPPLNGAISKSDVVGVKPLEDMEDAENDGDDDDAARGRHKEFQEAKHPRKGKGDPAGGEFAPKAWQAEVPEDVQAQAPEMAARARQYADNVQKYLGTESHDETPFKPKKWTTGDRDFEKPEASFQNAGEELRARARYLRHFADEVDTHDVVRGATAHGLLQHDDQRDLEGYDKAHAYFLKVRGMMKPAAVATAVKEAGWPQHDWTRFKEVHAWWTLRRHSSESVKDTA